MNCRNKLFYLLLNLSVLLFLIAIPLILYSTDSHAVTLDRVIATVGNEIITLAEYQKFVKSIGQYEQLDVVDEILLRKLIEEKVILNEAKKKGIEISEKEIDEEIDEFCKENGFSKEKFDEILKEEGMTLNMFREIIRNRIMLMRFIYSEVDSKIIISEKEIEDFYNANKKSYLASPETVDIKAIFLKMKEDASVTEITDLKRRSLKIVDSLKRGESFERLAEEYSDEPLKSSGGILGTFTRNSLIASLDKKVFLMKKGEISEPIWLSEGVYIVMLVDINTELYLPLEDVKNDIKNELYKVKRERYFNEWLKTLWEKASVTISLT